MPDFDAIVVGSGITGGWAAKELTERGLKTLVLEAGATDELHFEMIPGSYQGCPAEPIKEEPEQR